MAYYLSKDAETDIRNIFIEGAQTFGIQQAERYHDQLAEIFQFLSDNPRVAYERPELSPPVRIHPFQSHIVVYAIDGNEDVFIVRVRHGHENWVDD
ncbi:MAG: type II toxin-antitoxin system RelE/ParE family toxin [Marinobacter sp.]|nr:type II toxin-antitoxin system RelE/ParE family toxin [Marinobacter sp.]